MPREIARAGSVRRARHRQIAIPQLQRPRPQWLLDAADEDHTRLGQRLERIARPEDEIGLAARLKRADPVADAVGAGQVDRDRCERRRVGQAVGDGVARAVAKFAGAVGDAAAGLEDDGHPGGVDAVGAIANCIEALTAPGEAVLVQTPAYPPLLSSVRVAGRELIEMPLDAGIDDALLRERKVRMILLCHPHNPTGRVFAEAELTTLAALAERHELIIVSDEIHADLTHVPNVHLPFAPFAPERTVTLNAPSKAFNAAGLRTAVCAARPALRARLTALPPTRWSAFSTLGLRAALAAWSGEGEAWLDSCVSHLGAMRNRLALRLGEEVPQIRFAPPAAGYLAWLDCRALEIGDPAAFFLDRARVALSAGPDFAAPGAGFARLNFATSTEILGEIVDRMAAVLR